MKSEKEITITQSDYNEEEQIRWGKTVEIVRWEHDFENEIYIINYNEKK